MSNIFDPAQARHVVGPDIGPNCWASSGSKLLAKNTGWVVTWFPLGYTVRKNGGLLSTPMF